MVNRSQKGNWVAQLNKLSAASSFNLDEIEAMGETANREQRRRLGKLKKKIEHLQP